MDRKYLEEYSQKEQDEYERVVKKILEGKFSFEKDRYPPDERFINLQKPVAYPCTPPSVYSANLWAQVPLCGSLIFLISPIPKLAFEEWHFKASQISKIIDFINETGRLQVALSSDPLLYEGLDYLEPIFRELNPPYYGGIPNSFFGDAKDIKLAEESFYTHAKVGYLDLLKRLTYQFGSQLFTAFLIKSLDGYTRLKLAHYSIIEEIENLMIDDPQAAYILLHSCRLVITDPLDELRSTVKNFTLEDLKFAQTFPLENRARNIRFPVEIGKFLFKKLTYAPQGIRACYELIDHYEAYDLLKVAKSLNEAVVANHPDIVNKSAGELCEILDNIWNNKIIPRRVKGLKIGIPLSMAVIGNVAAGPIGAVGGFLVGLGYSVADKFIDLETEGLSERLAKLKTKSYQANIYDFKEKYKHRIVQT